MKVMKYMTIVMIMVVSLLSTGCSSFSQERWDSLNAHEKSSEVRLRAHVVGILASGLIVSQLDDDDPLALGLLPMGGAFAYSEYYDYKHADEIEEHWNTYRKEQKREEEELQAIKAKRDRDFEAELERLGISEFEKLDRIQYILED
jgi:hypothetical protein